MIHAFSKAVSAGIRGTVAMALLLSAIPQAGAQAVLHPRLSSAAADDGTRTQLAGAEPLVAGYGTDRGALASSEPLQSMKLVLRRGSAEKAAVGALLDRLQDSHSPSFHAWLTPDEFGRRFGASDEDIAAVTSWLQQQGFTVDSVSKGRTVVTFSGTEGQFQTAFQAEMHRYLVDGELRIANASIPTVPSRLAPAIVGLATLGNAHFRPTHTSPVPVRRDPAGAWHREDNVPAQSGSAAVVKPQADVVKPQADVVKPQFTELSANGALLLLGPADFATMYGVKPVWSQGLRGANQSIAIVAESNIARADVDAFRKAFGLPATKLNISVLGPDPGLRPSDGSEGEAVLDVEWAGATAPEADINLLVASSTPTDAGIVIAAQYAIDNNLSPILNLSWGACELNLQAGGNQFFSDLWSQAAAQGISVIVSSGDAVSVACDQNKYYAKYGQQVNGIASPLNAIAIGGTDFPVNAEHVRAYWNPTNDPTTLQSVKSYVPEGVWNDTCASPDVLAHASSFGLTETTNAAICNNEVAFLNTVGGGGGISLCTASDGVDQGTCTGGYDAPAWQSSFGGVGAGGKRRLPDVSFFSGAGLWASAYAVCQADTAVSSTDCVNNQGVMTASAAGGTSFAAPAFSGILALLNQQQGSRQGNINKYLYALAAQQFADPALSASCQSADGNGSAGCIFHDVIRGNSAGPCVPGTIVDPAAKTICTPANSSDYVGIAAGYDAAPGFDAATGLGSVDASNLLSNWSKAIALDAASVTTQTIASAVSVPYGSTSTVNVFVAAASGSAVPTGAVSLLSAESNGNTLAVVAGALNAGAATLQFNSLLVGVHALSTSYGGDAKFGASRSASAKLTVVQAATSLSATPSAGTVTAPNSLTVLVQVQTASTALSPTGFAVFTNHATGAALGSVALTPSPTVAGSWSVASLKVPGTALASGQNVIDVSYVGDSNYLAASPTSVAVKYVPAFTVVSNQTSLDIDLAGTGQATAVITIPSSSGIKVNPALLSMTCQSILPITGLSCGFSPLTTNSSGVVSSTLTVTANNPRTAAVEVPARPVRGGHAGPVTIALCGMFLLWIKRRSGRFDRLTVWVLLTCSALGSAMLSGCASSPQANSVATVVNQLTISSAKPAYGTAVTLTSTLTASSTPASLSGTVLFYDGPNLLGSSPVSGSSAQLTVGTLNVGMHSISATYSGDSKWMPSTSQAQTVDIQLATTLNVKVSDTAGNTAQLALPVVIH